MTHQKRAAIATSLTLFVLIAIGSSFLPKEAFAAFAPVSVPAGGTGVGTFTAGLLGGSGTNKLFTQATTTVSCSGNTSCTGFVAIGPSPITITSSGGGTGLSTTTPLANSNLLTYSTAGAGAAYGTATSSIGAGTGLSFSGTAGAQVGGTNGTYSVNTTQNITKLSNLTTNGFVQTSSGDGTLSSAALTSGQVTTALGFTPQTSLWSSAAGTTFLNKDLIAGFPSLSATSTTATSTFLGDVAIGGTGVLPNPYLFIGTSTSHLPLFGRVAGDLIDAEYDWNGQSSINVVNANVGSCASATFFADGNNPTLGGYFGTFSFLNDGWTGAGCSIGVGTAQKPEAVAIASPTGEMDFIIASTTQNGFADFNWFSNTNTQLMKLTNAGSLGIGTTSPHAQLSVNAGNTSITKPLIEASYSTGATNNATTTVFSIATSTGTAVNIATTSAIGSNVLTVNGGVYFHGLATGAGNGALCATTDGLVSYDAGANCIVSSLRFKNVDATITPEESLATVLKLSPIFFHYKQGYGDNGKAQQEGFGAEEVALVDTNLVQYDAHGDPFSVFYQNITAKLVGAVQAIWNRLDSQQQEIDTLKAQVKALQDAKQRPLPKQL